MRPSWETAGLREARSGWCSVASGEPVPGSVVIPENLALRGPRPAERLAEVVARADRIDPGISPRGAGWRRVAAAAREQDAEVSET